ncbi:MAG: FMN-dependent NADH-azoreductase [Caulobacteraceae bacterium]
MRTPGCPIFASQDEALRLTVLLHISASPKGAHSASGQIAEAFLEAYAGLHPNDEIRRLPVFDADLPGVGPDEVEAKFAPIYGYALEARHVTAWARVVREIDHLKEADKIVLSSPMWNFGVPYRLKQYFDVIIQPGLTFSYDRVAMRHIGLLKNRPTQLILTRSSVMPGDFGDFQLPYLKYVLDFMGINDVRVINAWQTTRAAATERQAYVESFMLEAREAARRF